MANEGNEKQTAFNGTSADAHFLSYSVLSQEV